MPISTDKKWLKGRSKHMSGFCNENGKPGQHEGNKPKNFLGHPLKTCPFWDSCPCECHKSVDLLFEMTKMERREIPNPEYVPDHGGFVPPEVDSDPLGTVASSAVGVMTPLDVERPVGVASVAPTAPLAQRRTPTGRAARGGLEAQVWDACTRTRAEALTPKAVAEWIAEEYKIPTPSTGAVNAVWARWENLGFAKTAKKPNRFLEFTGEGTWEELTRIKSSSKRQKKSAESLARRGFRK